MELKYKHLTSGETFMFLPTAARPGGGPFRKVNNASYFDLNENKVRRIASISVPVRRVA